MNEDQQPDEIEERAEDGTLSTGELNEMIEQVCLSKAQEFHLIGYPQVTGADIWECVSSKYKRDLPPLHRLINDILTLKTTTFMTFVMKKSYME
ncbi:MAG: post-transcriptional regulator [Tumebacillaceae bacterium]